MWSCVFLFTGDIVRSIISSDLYPWFHHERVWPQHQLWRALQVLPNVRRHAVDSCVGHVHYPLWLKLPLSSPVQCNLFLQISFHPGALEECVLQPGSLYVRGCRWLLRPCRHTPLSGNTNKIKNESTCQGWSFTSMQMVPLRKVQTRTLDPT